MADPRHDGPLTFAEHAAGGHGINNKNYSIPAADLPVIRPDTDGIGATKNVTKGAATVNLAKGHPRFIARVLRIENKDTPEQDENIFGGWFDSLTLSEETQSNTHFTAIIDCGKHSTAWGSSCLSHPDFQLPKDRGCAYNAVSERIIDKIRDGFEGLFIDPDPKRDPPDIGSLVEVTFADLENQVGGIYLNPIEGSGKSPPVDNSKAPSRRECNELNSAPPAGSNVNGSNARTKSQPFSFTRKETLDAKRERGEFPIGKGVFTGTPDLSTHPVKQAEEATLNWICYKALEQGPAGAVTMSTDITKAKAFADAYHKEGMRTYMMTYPRYNEKDAGAAFVTKTIDFATKTDAIGIIINLDFYYSGYPGATPPDSKYTKESYLMKTLRDAANEHGFCIGLTATYLGAKKNWPWRIFSKNVDFAIPQVLEQDYNNLRATNATTDPPLEDTSSGGPSDFEDITPNNLKGDSIVLDEATKDKFFQRATSTSRGFKQSEFDAGPEDRKARTLYLMAAAEVLEQYWRQMYPNAEVHISSHIRASSPNHKSGAAMDVYVKNWRDGAPGKKMPALQCWAGLQKIREANRVPNGGVGIYLNLRSSGIKGTSIDDNIDATATGVGKLGGSTGGSTGNPHYDMREYTYPKSGANAYGKGGTWIHGDSEGKVGEDNLDGKSKVFKHLNNNGLSTVTAYLKGGWRNDPEIPGVGSDIPNVKQLLSLESYAPRKPLKGAELAFVNKFKAWKKAGFKHIVPALGTRGKGPAPDGWSPDSGTQEKPPWRMREEATWAFTSVKKELSTSMANSIIWWDWTGATEHKNLWPEKRWDIITELGIATAQAEKLNSLETTEGLEEIDKNRIKIYKLGDFLKQNIEEEGSSGEEK
tara:strand:+ start:82 stop:2694 length:2613 start_codon:yes stop_codon:yes gene_type:complete